MFIDLQGGEDGFFFSFLLTHRDHVTYAGGGRPFFQRE